MGTSKCDWCGKHHNMDLLYGDNYRNGRTFRRYKFCSRACEFYFKKNMTHLVKVNVNGLTDEEQSNEIALITDTYGSYSNYLAIKKREKKQKETRDFFRGLFKVGGIVLIVLALFAGVSLFKVGFFGLLYFLTIGTQFKSI